MHKNNFVKQLMMLPFETVNPQKDISLCKGVWKNLKILRILEHLWRKLLTVFFFIESAC